MANLDSLLERELASRSCCRVHEAGACPKGCEHAYDPFDHDPFDPETLVTEKDGKVVVLLRPAREHDGYEIVANPKKGKEYVLAAILAGDMFAAIDYAQDRTGVEWNDSTDDYNYCAEHLAKKILERLAPYGLARKGANWLERNAFHDAVLSLVMPGPVVTNPIAVVMVCRPGMQWEV